MPLLCQLCGQNTGWQRNSAGIHPCRHLATARAHQRIVLKLEEEEKEGRTEREQSLLFENQPIRYTPAHWSTAEAFFPIWPPFRGSGYKNCSTEPEMIHYCFPLLNKVFKLNRQVQTKASTNTNPCREDVESSVIRVNLLPCKRLILKRRNIELFCSAELLPSKFLIVLLNPNPSLAIWSYYSNKKKSTLEMKPHRITNTNHG